MATAARSWKTRMATVALPAGVPVCAAVGEDLHRQGVAAQARAGIP